MLAPLKIGQAARMTGLTIKALRYYEAVGILPPPPRNEGRYRVYGPAEIRHLTLIKQARAIGFTLEQTKEFVELADSGCCPTIRPGMQALIHEKLRQLDERIRDLAALRTALWEFQQKLSEKMDAASCAPDRCVPSVDVPVTFFVENVPRNTHLAAAKGESGRRANADGRSATPQPRSGR